MTWVIIIMVAGFALGGWLFGDLYGHIKSLREDIEELEDLVLNKDD